MIDPPTHWMSKPLAELCDVVIGRTPARANPLFWGDGHRWLSIADMKDREIAETSESITDAAVAECGCREVQPGTVVMSFKLSVGKVGIVRAPMFTNEAIAALPILMPDCIDPTFLFYALQVADLGVKDRAAKGLTLNKPKLERIRVAFPPLAEQKRIAAILDKADAIRRRRQEAARLADTLMTSGFHYIVGPLAQGYRSWKRGTIESLASPEPGSMRTGPFGSDLRHSEFVSEGVAVLGIDNAVQNRFAWDERRFITRDKYEYLQRYTVRPNDVIVTIMGTTGRSAVVPDDIPLAITTKHLATITVNRKVAEPEFVSHSIYRHPEVLSQIENSHRGAIMPGLNLTLIRRLELPVPPIDVQKGFTEFVKAVRELEATHASKQQVADDIFNSLVQRAFRGEL